MTTNDGRAFAAEITQATEPDPMNYWKPEIGDALFGWIAGMDEVPNNFFNKDREEAPGNRPTQIRVLLVEDEIEQPILVYASGAVLARLFERGPSSGKITRAPRVGDHIGIKRLEDEVPTVKGRKPMKQFFLRIDPEPPTMPALVASTIEQKREEAREQRALGAGPAKPVANHADEFANESVDDLDLPKGSQVIDGVVHLPEDQTPF